MLYTYTGIKGTKNIELKIIKRRNRYCLVIAGIMLEHFSTTDLAKLAAKKVIQYNRFICKDTKRLLDMMMYLTQLTGKSVNSLIDLGRVNYTHIA